MTLEENLTNSNNAKHVVLKRERHIMKTKLWEDKKALKDLERLKNQDSRRKQNSLIEILKPSSKIW
jgi:hypothetical protein